MEVSPGLNSTRRTLAHLGSVSNTRPGESGGGVQAWGGTVGAAMSPPHDTGGRRAGGRGGRLSQPNPSRRKCARPSMFLRPGVGKVALACTHQPHKTTAPPPPSLHAKECPSCLHACSACATAQHAPSDRPWHPPSLCISQPGQALPRPRMTDTERARTRARPMPPRRKRHVPTHRMWSCVP